MHRGRLRGGMQLSQRIFSNCLRLQRHLRGNLRRAHCHASLFRLHLAVAGRLGVARRHSRGGLGGAA